MSQDNSFIIAKSKELKIPKEIPHFFVGDDIYLPINITTGYEFNNFINSVLENKKYDLRDYYTNDFYFLELTKKLNISSFVAYHCSEFVMPLNIYEFTVVNNTVIEKSIWSNEEGIMTPENYSEVAENYDKNNSEILLNIKIDLYFIEKLKYFEIAESLYKKWGNLLDFSEIDKINRQKIEENRKKSLENESQEIRNFEDSSEDIPLEDIPSDSFWGEIKRILKL
ncbi:hypothetical protein AB9T88_13780 [Flavobacterium sp. LBUM151]